MNSLLLPDINVWVALNFDQHTHHAAAKQWYEDVPDASTLTFCRQTQLGLFRILATSAVMGERVFAQMACWQLFDQWVGTGQVAWAEEPGDLGGLLRRSTSSTETAPKVWMDAYLAAFAEAGHFRLVTFDRALAAKSPNSILLD